MYRGRHERIYARVRVSVGFTCSSTFFLPVQTRNRGLKSGLFMKTRDASYAFTGVQLGDTIAAKASEYSASCETTKRNGYIYSVLI